MNKLIYDVVDIETSDIDPKIGGEIAEIAIIRCSGVEIIDVFHQFFSVGSFHPKAAAVNGFSVELLQHWPSFKSFVNSGTAKSLFKYPIFAHNAPFERKFLVYHDAVLPDHVFKCTLSLARKSTIKTENHKLITLLEHFGIPHRPHGALSDAIGTAKLIHFMGWQSELFG